MPLPAALPLAVPPSMVSMFAPPMLKALPWALTVRLLISKSALSVVARLPAGGFVVAKVTFEPTPGMAPAGLLLVASVFQLPTVVQFTSVAPLQTAAAGPATAAVTLTCRLLPLTARLE